MREVIEEGAGENKGGVGFAEVEFDSPTVGEIAGRYFVCCCIRALSHADSLGFEESNGFAD